MTITLNTDYDVTLNTALLGYVGETNARPVSVEGLTVDGADRYVLTIDYGDGTVYEVDITGGQWTPTADILRSAQTVSCQICAKKLSGDEYILLKKSRIFRLRIGAAIGDTAIPSPSVAADALDRISAIGEQVEADVERAENAASTAMQAAENAKKSATAAGLSADTATQAASRAETAKTAAETSAAQSETARQGAENARQQAVTSQNAAKVSAAQAATSAQQTTVDKNITAGYAQTAKTNADNTATDRQAVQTLATQVTTDKATVADHAAQVATDRKAAETAAQTAQAVADSLPEDYVTAVAKIAENTAEISAVKLTDKELQRRVNALYDMGNGITHQFETDSGTAYAKTIPTGSKLMSVKNVGGRSIVFNQNFQPRKEINNGITATADSDGTITLNGTTTASYINFRDVTPEQNKVGKYAFKLLILNNPDSISMKFGFLNRSQSTPAITSGSSAVIYNQTQSEISLGKATGISGFAVGTVFNDVKIKIQIFDLTAMFGSGNEPSTVKEFEAMFPNDYYPYNVGEIISAGTESVVEQGKNLWNIDGYTASDLVDLKTGYWGVKLNVKPNSTYCISVTRDTVLSGIYGKLMGADKRNIGFFGHTTTSAINAYTGHPITFQTANENYVYVAINSFKGFDTWKSDFQKYFPSFQIEKSSTATAYAPYHSNEYPIPEAIKALPGYGWSAGTARNYVDYENKKYVQCVNSVDLGTKNWRMYKDGDYTPFFYLNAVSDIRGGTSNFLCPKYQYVKIGVTDSASGLYVLENTTVRVRDTAYTDAATFKQAMQGVMLYYELATPIVTDISTLIPDDFLRNIEVEAGGSVTFKNSNGDDYRIPVPSEEEYIVKLSEIGGTT
ncbi:MAG: hypothetical protein [Bacteriophage sp.]|nr:MAG: hypothetical protein [Bacteriophage sp.]